MYEEKGFSTSNILYVAVPIELVKRIYSNKLTTSTFQIIALIIMHCSVYRFWG